MIGLLSSFQCFDIEDTWDEERIAGQITLIIGLLRAHSHPCCHHITQLLVSNAQIRLFPGKNMPTMYSTCQKVFRTTDNRLNMSCPYRLFSKNWFLELVKI